MAEMKKKELATAAREVLRPARGGTATSRGPGDPMNRDLFLAKHVLAHWRQQQYIALAASILRNASTLKEAQVLSQQMGQDLVFQYTIVDLGHT
ncbi:hypothetical protein LTR53_020003, partial [Teratosphaeriaceae sp. CCFEE 6253]